jgi:hypothetical protein
MVADASAANQNAPAGQPPVQSSPSTAPPQVIAPSAAASSGKSATGSQTDSTPTPSATAGKLVLVDDTLNDAQLKQILARGYRPTSQARGNEVLYCRSESELGTRFEKKVCKTATRIIQDELNGKEETTRLQQTGVDRTAKK